jgi:hypothetical protein
MKGTCHGEHNSVKAGKLLDAAVENIASLMHPTNLLLNPIELMLLRHLKGRIWLQVQSLLGGSLRPSKVLLIALFLCATLSAPRGQAQQALVLDPLPQSSRDLCSLNSQSTAPPQDPSQKTDSGQNGSQSGSQSGSKIDSPQPKTDPNQIQTGTQTKRILWIVPNFRSVSADTYLPPQSFREKLWLATQESFDYSAFIYEGIVAGISMAQNRNPPSARALLAMESTTPTPSPMEPLRITWSKLSSRQQPKKIRVTTPSVTAAFSSVQVMP